MTTNEILLGLGLLLMSAVGSAPLPGMSVRADLMLGAILVVSGPTAAGPLLSFVHSTERSQRLGGLWNAWSVPIE
jgi:hypothetical protein